MEVLDDENKTVVRFRLTSLFPDDKSRLPFFRVCHFVPLRGYESELAKTIAILSSHGVRPIDSGPLMAYFEAFGEVPEVYTTKPSFDLAPALGGREAMRRIIRTQLAIARRNEAGVIESLDTEFLHDYRVALRKIRAVLSQVREVYPPAVTRRLRESFSLLMRKTNRLRDLDVYLLDHDALLALLPESLQPGLEIMFADFRRAAAAEQKSLARHLRSASYRRSIEALERVVAEPDELPASASSEKAIVALVSDRIGQRYRKIRRTHRDLSPSTPDAEVHELRLDCKKLRYLLELFRELYDHNDLDRLIKSLKRLQDCLGDFNDYSVQQEALLAYLREKEAGPESASSDLAMAVGGLIAVLSTKQKQKRDEVAAVLGPFCSKRIRAALDHMLVNGQAAAA
jgi:CHAD domain-containing protein